MTSHHRNLAKKPLSPLRDISLDLILEPTSAVRTQIDQKALDELAATIRAQGQIEPAIVRPSGEFFEIIVGHRRFLACQMLHLATLSCIVREMSDQDAFTQRLIENFARAGVSPCDEAIYLHNYIESFDITQDQLAKRLGRSTAWVSQRLAIANYDQALRTALEREQITFSVARELSKIDDPNTLSAYLDAAITGGCTPAQARSWVSDYQHFKEFNPAHTEGEDQPMTYQVPEPLVLHCALCGEPGQAAKMRNLWVDPSCFQAAVDALIKTTSTPED
jgi:ParB family chromosome partitioning protein